MPSAALFDQRYSQLGSLSERVYGLPLCSATDNIVAKAGGGQALGTPLISVINRVVTVASIGDSTVLPVAAPGLSLTVVNASASSMNVFPAVGDQTNSLGVNAAFTVAAGKTVEFFAAATLQWHTILSA